MDVNNENKRKKASGELNCMEKKLKTLKKILAEKERKVKVVRKSTKMKAKKPSSSSPSISLPSSLRCSPRIKSTQELQDFQISVCSKVFFDCILQDVKTFPIDDFKLKGPGFRKLMKKKCSNNSIYSENEIDDSSLSNIPTFAEVSPNEPVCQTNSNNSILSHEIVSQVLSSRPLNTVHNENTTKEPFQTNSEVTSTSDIEFSKSQPNALIPSNILNNPVNEPISKTNSEKGILSKPAKKSSGQLIFSNEELSGCDENQMNENSSSSSDIFVLNDDSIEKAPNDVVHSPQQYTRRPSIELILQNEECTENQPYVITRSNTEANLSKSLQIKGFSSISNEEYNSSNDKQSSRGILNMSSKSDFNSATGKVNLLKTMINKFLPSLWNSGNILDILPKEEIISPNDDDQNHNITSPSNPTETMRIVNNQSCFQCDALEPVVKIYFNEEHCMLMCCQTTSVQWWKKGRIWSLSKVYKLPQDHFIMDSCQVGGTLVLFVSGLTSYSLVNLNFAPPLLKEQSCQLTRDKWNIAQLCSLKYPFFASCLTNETYSLIRAHMVVWDDSEATVKHILQDIPNEPIKNIMIIENLTNGLLGCGKEHLILWNYNSGRLLKKITLQPILDTFSCFWAATDASLLFVLLKEDFGEKHQLAVVNLNTADYKIVQSYPKEDLVPMNKNGIRKCSVQNGSSIFISDQNGLTVCDIYTGDIWASMQSKLLSTAIIFPHSILHTVKMAVGYRNGSIHIFPLT